MFVLIKRSKRTGAVRNVMLQSLEELEEELKKLQPSYYLNNDYFVESKNFDLIVDFLKKTYNRNFYTFDYALSIVKINKLSRGERKYIGKNTKFADKNVFGRAIRRISKKYDGIYDEDLGVLTLFFKENKIDFIFNESRKIGNIFVGEIKSNEAKELFILINKIIKYFEDLSKKKEVL